MSASIREILKICRNDGGFTTTIECVDQDAVRAKVYRAGCQWSTELMLDLSPVEIKGMTFYFALPIEFWSYPIGYYDVDLYHGDQFIRTIRLDLYATPQTGKSYVKESVSECDLKELPNIDSVVDCCNDPCQSCGGCCCDACDTCICIPTGINKCPELVNGDKTYDTKNLINTAHVATNEDMISYVCDLVEELDNLIEQGCYYNQQCPIPDELIEKTQQLKKALDGLQVAPTEEAMDAITVSAISMQNELNNLKSQISSENATVSRMVRRPKSIPLQPKESEATNASIGKTTADMLDAMMKGGQL